MKKKLPVISFKSSQKNPLLSTNQPQSFDMDMNLCPELSIPNPNRYDTPPPPVLQRRPPGIPDKNQIMPIKLFPQPPGITALNGQWSPLVSPVIDTNDSFQIDHSPPRTKIEDSVPALQPKPRIAAIIDCSNVGHSNCTPKNNGTTFSWDQVRECISHYLELEIEVAGFISPRTVSYNPMPEDFEYADLISQPSGWNSENDDISLIMHAYNLAKKGYRAWIITRDMFRDHIQEGSSNLDPAPIKWLRDCIKGSFLLISYSFVGKKFVPMRDIVSAPYNFPDGPLKMLTDQAAISDSAVEGAAWIILPETVVKIILKKNPIIIMESRENNLKVNVCDSGDPSVLKLIGLPTPSNCKNNGWWFGEKMNDLIRAKVIASMIHKQCSWAKNGMKSLETAENNVYFKFPPVEKIQMFKSLLSTQQKQEIEYGSASDLIAEITLDADDVNDIFSRYSNPILSVFGSNWTLSLSRSDRLRNVIQISNFPTNKWKTHTSETLKGVIASMVHEQYGVRTDRDLVSFVNKQQIRQNTGAQKRNLLTQLPQKLPSQPQQTQPQQTLPPQTLSPQQLQPQQTQPPQQLQLPQKHPPQTQLQQLQEKLTWSKYMQPNRDKQAKTRHNAYNYPYLSDRFPVYSNQSIWISFSYNDVRIISEKTPRDRILILKPDNHELYVNIYRLDRNWVVIRNIPYDWREKNRSDVKKVISSMLHKKFHINTMFAHFSFSDEDINPDHIE